ncbi:O-antigen polymerase [Amedibacillus sp. YH-ame6]
MINQENKKISLYLILGTVFFALFGYITSINNYVGSILILIEAIVLYFVFAKWNDNFMSLSALYTGIWLGTIGLANLQLLKYQKPWVSETWIYVVLAFFIFNVMILLGNRLGDKSSDKVARWLQTERKSFKFEVQNNRIYYICVSITIISFICLLLTWKIVGFLPFFVTNDPAAYLKFYTKFHLITQASTIISGLCYYAIKKCDLTKAKKIILYICIFYLIFFMPIIVVARGIFICSALSLTTAVFFLNGKKFFILILCLAFTFGGYELGSFGRHYSSKALDSFFEPKELGGEEGDVEVNPNDIQAKFKLPPKAAFLYSYFTVSHDNFNLAVRKAEDYTYGVRQLHPFKFVLKRVFGEYDKNYEFYKIKPSLTTTNFLGTSFYDLRYIGVALFLSIWGFVFGIIETLYRKIKHPILLLVHGNNLSPVFLCFFSAFVNQVSYWMYLAVIILLFFLVCYKKKKVN